MKRDLNKLLMMPDMKTPMTYGEGLAPMTVGAMISEAAIGMYPNETPQPDAREKSLRFKLAVRVGLHGEQDFTQTELDCIKRVSHLKCGSWLYGQIDAWVEGVDPFAEHRKSEDQPKAEAPPVEEVKQQAA